MFVGGLWDIIMPYKNKEAYREYYEKNRGYFLEKSRRRYLENKEGILAKQKTPSVRLRRRISQIKHKYGLSEVDYNNMLHDQKNKCKICDVEFIESAGHSNQGYVPHVDHCHESGKVRGLLCGNCNKGLGLFKDSKKNLQSAMEYLE